MMNPWKVTRSNERNDFDARVRLPGEALRFDLDLRKLVQRCGTGEAIFFPHALGCNVERFACTGDEVIDGIIVTGLEEIADYLRRRIAIFFAIVGPLDMEVHDGHVGVLMKL